MFELDQNFARAHLLLSVIDEAEGLEAEAVAARLRWRTLSGAPDAEIAWLRQAFAAGGLRGFYRAWVEALNAESKRAYVRPMAFVAACIGSGDREQAFRWLERAYRERDSQLMFLSVSPIYDGLRADARFTSYLRKLGR